MQTINILLKAGANVNNPAGVDSPLIRAATSLSATQAQRIYLGNLDPAQMVRLLVDAGADVNVADRKGKTPLMFATLWGYDSLVPLLLDHGADVRMRDNNRKTALDYAEQFGQKKIVEILNKRGAVHGHELRNPAKPD